MSAARRRALPAAALAAGLVAGSSATFAALGAAGAALDPDRASLVAAAFVCVGAAALDAAGVRVRPQNRFQVPEPWRRTLPLPVAAALYGLLLGSGVAGTVPAAAVWAVALVVLALGSPGVALAVGIAFGVGRALPVLALSESRIGLLTERPAPLRAVRFLVACTVAASAVAALAGGAAAAAVGPVGDPSVAGADVAWNEPGVGGFLRTAAETKQLPGANPAIGGALVAWREGDTVTVASRATLAPIFQEQIVGVRELAISDTWLVLRTLDAKGRSRLIAQSIADTSVHRPIAAIDAPSTIGRPSLDGATVVFATATRSGSWISAVDLTTGKSRRVRRASDAQLLNPSLLGSELLYVESSRCSQQLRLEPLDRKGGRAVMTLPPTAGADAGHEHGYTTQGERRPCNGRIRPTATLLWTTALSPTHAYVTTLRPRRGAPTAPTLLELRR